MLKDLSPEALLLSQPTGSGESATPQTYYVVSNVTSIIIGPTLALSSDQSSKFDTSSNEHSGFTCSHHLESHKN